MGILLFYSSPSYSTVGESVANTILHHRVSSTGLLSLIHQTCLTTSLIIESLLMISFLRLSESSYKECLEKNYLPTKDEKANGKKIAIMTNTHVPQNPTTSTFQSLLGQKNSPSVYRSEPTVYLKYKSIFIIRGFRTTLIMSNSSLHF